jgi:hypothetical protein
VAFYDTAAIITAVLRATGHSTPASETTKRLALLEFVNLRYHAVCLARHWRWMLGDKEIDITAPYATGTVDVIQGSTTVTGTGTFTGGNAAVGDIFVGGGSSEAHRVASITSATVLELESKLAGDTLADATYNVYRPRIAMPSTVDNVTSMTVDGVGELVPLGQQEFERLRSSNSTLSGAPKYYTQSRLQSDNDALYVDVYPLPDQRYSAHYQYTVRVGRLSDSATDYAVIPDRHRGVLFHGALADFYRYLRDPVNSATAETDYQRFLAKMCGDTQLTDSRLIFTPARNYRNRHKRTKTFKDRYEFGRDD